VSAILLSKRSSNNRILSALSAKNQPPAATPVGRIYIEKRYYETITASAVATGCVNAFAHRERIGWVGAGALAILITGFVEVFYFTLRHGLSTTYKSGMQRLAATLCYRTIQVTMILNAAVLCAWVTGVAIPPILASWNRWSIALHFTLALLGVAAVRDSNPVVISRSGCDFTKAAANE
jgi:hypothetical protein